MTQWRPVKYSYKTALDHQYRMRNNEKNCLLPTPKKVFYRVSLLKPLIRRVERAKNEHLKFLR